MIPSSFSSSIETNALSGSSTIEPGIAGATLRDFESVAINNRGEIAYAVQLNGAGINNEALYLDSLLLLREGEGCEVTDAESLSEPIENLRNLGATSAAWLREVGISTVDDLKAETGKTAVEDVFLAGLGENGAAVGNGE